MYVKGARGAIVRYAALTGATKPEQLKGFTGLQGEWRYVAAASDDRNYVFERGTPKAAAPKPKGKRAAEGDDADEAPRKEAPAKAAKRGASRR